MAGFFKKLFNRVSGAPTEPPPPPPAEEIAPPPVEEALPARDPDAPAEWIMRELLAHEQVAEAPADAGPAPAPEAETVPEPPPAASQEIVPQLVSEIAPPPPVAPPPSAQEEEVAGEEPAVIEEAPVPQPARPRAGKAAKAEPKPAPPKKATGKAGAKAKEPEKPAPKAKVHEPVKAPEKPAAKITEAKKPVLPPTAPQPVEIKPVRAKAPPLVAVPPPTPTKPTPAARVSEPPAAAPKPAKPVPAAPVPEPPAAPPEPVKPVPVARAPEPPATPPPAAPAPVPDTASRIEDAAPPAVAPKRGALVKDRTPAPQPAAAPDAGRWLNRLRDGLSKSSRNISGSIGAIFTKKKLDAATLQDLEDALLQADLGLPMAERIIKAVSIGRYDREVDPAEVRRILAEEVAKVLKPVEIPFNFGDEKPFVILVIGVNGSGKTTTIGKLGAIAAGEGFKVMFAACDTFRAAAIEQLTVWGKRIGARTISRPTGADASGLAFDAMKAAQEDGTDIMFIDTAGRLQNKAHLMDELDKVVRVIKKVDVSAPHAVLLVLDATTGQNAMAQAEVFMRVAGVTGLIMTKLDGTARGGILVAIAEKFRLPVHAIGVGEQIEDLQPFDAEAFARTIAGLEQR